MAWFDGGRLVSSSSRNSKQHLSHSNRRRHSSRQSRSQSNSYSWSRSRSRSRNREAASIIGFFAGAPAGVPDYYASGSHSRRSPSLFGLGNASRGSFFNFKSGRTPSYYKRSPRHGFIQRAWRKLKRIVRDVIHFAKRHPLKVFMLVIMPLITTGALAGLLARFGLRLPREFERMMGMTAKASSGNSIGLVSDAVRMASEIGGFNHRTSYPYKPSCGDLGCRKIDIDADGSSSVIADGLKYLKMFL